MLCVCCVLLARGGWSVRLCLFNGVLHATLAHLTLPQNTQAPDTSHTTAQVVGRMSLADVVNEYAQLVTQVRAGLDGLADPNAPADLVT
jgi:hypothetical protein